MQVSTFAFPHRCVLWCHFPPVKKSSSWIVLPCTPSKYFPELFLLTVHCAGYLQEIGLSFPLQVYQLSVTLLKVWLPPLIKFYFLLVSSFWYYGCCGVEVVQEEEKAALLAAVVTAEGPGDWWSLGWKITVFYTNGHFLKIAFWGDGILEMLKIFFCFSLTFPFILFLYF